MEALPLSSAEVALVFGAALAGYLALTLAAVIAARRPAALSRRARGLAWAALTIITLHVVLLWTLRFGWDPAVATRNGYGGFVTFHLAFVTVWVVLPGPRWGGGAARWALLGAWALVTSGAVGAPFRYPIVADLAVPVIVIAAAGAIGIGHALLVPARTPLR